MTTFFGQTTHKFQPVPENGDIEAEPFLLAAKNLPLFFEMMGKAFTPVKNDVDGNITKLQKKLSQDPEKFKTFRAMLEEEKASGNNKSKDCATVALLWLKRGMGYVILFIQALIDDHRSGAKTESLVQINKNAYENTLKKYHGWVVQKLFSVVSHAMPYRKTVLKTLANEQDDMEDKVIDEMEEFLKPMIANVDVIVAMYEEMGLEDDKKI